MTTVTEGNLRITFPHSARVRKFDDGASHGLTHCMKAVDFIVEETDRVSFIELKDPEHPHARKENREKFIGQFLSGNLDEDLKYKYRDTFLYQWASRKIGKPIHYLVLIAIDSLTDAALLERTEDLKRKLPLSGPSSGEWKRGIITGCMVFNIKTWNRSLPQFPVSRIPSQQAAPLAADVDGRRSKPETKADNA